jgi:hypothetical protein
MRNVFLSMRVTVLIGLALAGSAVIAAYDIATSHEAGQKIARADTGPTCTSSAISQDDTPEDILFVGCGGFF